MTRVVIGGAFYAAAMLVVGISFDLGEGEGWVEVLVAGAAGSFALGVVAGRFEALVAPVLAATAFFLVVVPAEVEGPDVLVFYVVLWLFVFALFGGMTLFGLLVARLTWRRA